MPPSRLLLSALALALAASMATAGCGPTPPEALAAAQTALDAGDDAGAQEAFRRGLERHPEHLPLLLMAADFYLREHNEDHYKPRLGLHYANRAARADDSDRVEVTSARVRALRAMGQHDEAAETLSEALSRRPDDATLRALRDLGEGLEGTLALPPSLD